MSRRSKKGLVLLVDDDEDIRTLFDRALKGLENVKLLACEDLAAARAIIDSQRLSVAFVDKCLPDGDGVDFCRQLVDTVDFPCYVITGSGSTNDCLDALEAGIADYIPKPIHVQDIRDHVRRHVLVDEADEKVGAPMGRAEQGEGKADEKVGEPMGNPQFKVEREFHLVGESAAMIQVAVAVQRISKTDMTVLVIGESGTGKEIIAKQIHQLSERRDKKFVAVNCAAIPKDLIESTLFGHEKGAFTDAKSARMGLFEEAQGGTILLDEITSTSLDFQVKLLRVLQEETVRRVGSNVEIDLNVRVIAASNKKLDVEIAAGNFREDLYFRLKGSEIVLPRLSEREKDVMVLARHFGDRAASRLKKVVHFSRGVVDALERYSWPGNVRELESVIEYAFSRCNATVLLSDLPPSLREGIGERAAGRLFAAMGRIEDLIPMSTLIDQYTLHALGLFDGNKSRTAEKLGIHRMSVGAAVDRVAKGETVKYLDTFIGKPKRRDGQSETDESQSSLFTAESLVGAGSE